MDGTEVTIDWNKYLGNFTAFTLLNFPNLLHLDMSGCDIVSPDEFVDCIGYLSQLQVINLDKCIQFSQYDFVKIFQQLRHLRIISMLECTCLPFTPTYVICCSLPSLQKIDFEPANIDIEQKDWRRLVAIFFRVAFGTNFTHKCFNKV